MNRSTLLNPSRVVYANTNAVSDDTAPGEWNPHSPLRPLKCNAVKCVCISMKDSCGWRLCNLSHTFPVGPLLTFDCRFVG